MTKTTASMQQVLLIFVIFSYFDYIHKPELLLIEVIFEK